MEPESPKTILYYQIAEEISRDRCGVVYQALDPHRQRAVALRLYGRLGQEPPEFIWSYLPALERARHLEHENIVTVHDVQEWQGVVIVAMDLLDARTLDERLRSEPMSIAGFLDLALQMARALEYAHDCNVHHGDLRCSSILVGRDGHVTLTGFGIPFLRKDLGELPVDLPVDRIVYLSPEIIDGAAPGRPGDLYALGVIFYFMLTGRYPFGGEDKDEVIKKVRQGQVDYPLLRQLGIPGDLVLLIRRLLAGDRSERCADAHELVVTLESIMRFEEDLQRTSEPQRRRMSGRMYLLISLLAVFFVIIWSILSGRY